MAPAIRASASPRPVAAPSRSSSSRFGRPARPAMNAHQSVEASDIEEPIDDSTSEEEYIEKGEIHAHAQELAATISKSDFMVGSEGGSNTFKYADFVREAQAKAAQSVQ